MIFTVKKEKVGESLAEFCETHTAEQIQELWKSQIKFNHYEARFYTTTGDIILLGARQKNTNIKELGWSFTTTEHQVTEAEVWEGAVSETITLHIK